MTNYEYLRSLPLEEIAKEIADLPVCSVCAISNNQGCHMNTCIEAFIEWLKSERET